MKRFGNLWPSIIDFANLLSAAHQAQRGKRFRDNVLAFNYHLESELLTLQAELQTKTYQPGTYKTFEIKYPKPRLISAAPYRDRVVHHALCNIIVPLFERTFIQDSYANRIGFGSHRALRRFTQFARHHRYVLQCDIRKYFPSIDHEILKSLLRRKLKCPDTLWLLETLIDNSNDQEPMVEHFPGDDLLTTLTRRRGLPIGNLTSQFFANVYLNGFDHFVKEHLKASHYLRYVDDFALFSWVGCAKRVQPCSSEEGNDLQKTNRAGWVGRFAEHSSGSSPLRSPTFLEKSGIWGPFYSPFNNSNGYHGDKQVGRICWANYLGGNCGRSHPVIASVQDRMNPSTAIHHTLLTSTSRSRNESTQGHGNSK